MKMFALFAQSALLALSLAAPGCASNEPEAPPTEGAVDELATAPPGGETSVVTCTPYYCATCPANGFTSCSNPKPGGAMSSCLAHCPDHYCEVDSYCD